VKSSHDWLVEVVDSLSAALAAADLTTAQLQAPPAAEVALELATRSMWTALVALQESRLAFMADR